MANINVPSPIASQHPTCRAERQRRQRQRCDAMRGEAMARSVRARLLHPSFDLAFVCQQATRTTSLGQAYLETAPSCLYCHHNNNNNNNHHHSRQPLPISLLCIAAGNERRKTADSSLLSATALCRPARVSHQHPARHWKLGLANITVAPALWYQQPLCCSIPHDYHRHLRPCSS